MGFGFNLLLLFIIFPSTGILLFLWILSKRSSFAKILVLLWSGVIGLVILSSIVQFFNTKKRVEKNDIYGEYIIDRSKFPGPQADWQ